MVQTSVPRTEIKIGDRLGKGEWCPDSSGHPVFKAFLRATKFCYVVTDDQSLTAGDIVYMDDFKSDYVGNFLVFKKNGLSASFSSSANAANQITGKDSGNDNKSKGYQPDRIKSSDEIWAITRGMCR